MKDYIVRVPVRGYEYYDIEADSEEEAAKLVKSGEGVYAYHEVAFDGNCIVEEA